MANIGLADVEMIGLTEIVRKKQQYFMSPPSVTFRSSVT